MRTRALVVIFLISVAALPSAGCGGDESPTEPTAVCAFAISPADAAYSSAGGTGAVSVSVAAGCPWSATSNTGWIFISSGGSGSGPGTIAYSVEANSDTQPRSGVVSVGGRSHSISQEGRAPAACRYDLSPETANLGDEGGSRTFNVNTSAECAWTAVSSVPWVVATGGHGPGSGEVSYTVAPNNDTVERSATITVADRTFTIRQAGEAIACQYSISPVEFSPCMPKGTIVVTVTTQASCTWTARPDASWLSLPGGTSGIGSGAITVEYSDNYDAPRQGLVMVRWPTPTAGQNVRIAQAGCRYAVSRPSFNFAFSGGTGSFDVLQQSDPITCGSATQDRCVWTAVPDVGWISVTSPMPRAGDNPVAFAVAPNDAAAPRVGHVTVRDQVVTITQTGR